MKHMKVARGTARAKRRETDAAPSQASQAGMRADLAASLRKLGVQMYHKAATARYGEHSPFA